MQNIFYKQIIENSPIGYAYHKILCDENGKPCDYEYIEVNQAFEVMTGLKREKIIGKPISKVLPEIVESEFDWIACYGEIALKRIEKKFEQYSQPLKKWYKVHAFSPEKGYFITSVYDITHEKIQIQDISKLLELSDEFLSITKELDYQKITNIILKISKAKIAAFNLYDKDGKSYKTMAISGDRGMINKAYSILGMKIENERWTHDPIRAEKIKNKITTRFPVLYDLTGDVIPKSTIKLLTESFNFGETLVVKITKNNIMLGDFTIIMQKDETFNKCSLVELYAKQVGLVIERIRAENEAIANANLFHSLFGSMSSGAAIYKVINDGKMGKDYIVMDFNKSALAIENKTIDEVRGKSLYDLRPEIDEYGLIDSFQQVWKTGDPRHFPTKVYIDENYSNWYENRIFKLPTGEIVAIYDDVTEKMQTSKKLEVSESRYRSVISVSNTGAWEYNLKEKFLWCSPEYFEMLGRSVSDFKMDGTENLNETWIDLLHPDDKARAAEAFREYLENGSKGMYENYFRMKHIDAGWVWIWSRGQTLLNNDGSLSNLTVGTHINITQMKEMEHKLYDKKEQFKTTLLSVGDGIISTDENGNVMILNSIAENLTGWTYKEALGKPIEEVFNIVNEFTNERCENPVKEVLETGNIIELANHTMLISKDGIERPIEDSAAPIKDETGNITGVVLVFRDFTEKKKSQDEIKRLSFHDHLTGVYNRRFFETEIKRLDTENNLPITIIMGDVNGLKLINDSFGHFAGDELLEKVAEVISGSCRKTDILARIGGDEFAILMPKTSANEAKKFIDKMKLNLKKEKIRNMVMSVSFGHETKTDFTESIYFILRKAEDFMYNNKLFEGPSVRGKVINNIIETINEKSPREKAHSERVAKICFAISQELELDEREANQMKAFGLLHDIGKIAIDDNILNKTEALTETENREIRRHAEIGYRILSTANDMSEIADYVLLHHERWDGKGYPKGLKGKDIPLASRICSIADAYDAMTSDRSYRPAMPLEYAISELQENAGTQFDPEIVEIFLEKVLPGL